LYAESHDNLVLELGPSHALTGVLVALHAGAALLAVTLPTAIVIRIVLTAAIGASLYRSVRLHATRQARDAVVALMLTGDGDWGVRRRSASDWEPVRLVDRWVQPWLTLLVLRCETRRSPTNVVIGADAVPAEVFRRLRVRLRLGIETESGSYHDSHSADPKTDNRE
jgi:Membrane-bound toxin component of toxin-antitoxin system